MSLLLVLIGSMQVLFLVDCSNYFCYINTNEIPGELSRENMISSHVKITCYLHM